MSPSELSPETQIGLHSKELGICLLGEASFLPSSVIFHPMPAQEDKARPVLLDSQHPEPTSVLL